MILHIVSYMYGAGALLCFALYARSMYLKAKYYRKAHEKLESLDRSLGAFGVHFGTLIAAFVCFALSLVWPVSIVCYKDFDERVHGL
jgi:hypothetical protein